MTPPNTTANGRMNQRLRTRKDLLRAAARLLKAGGKPSMDDIAAEAMVSRATAYRYFPSLEDLLVEAPLETAVPDPDALFADDPSTDPADRIDKAEAALHAMCYANEAQLRIMLAHSLMRGVERGGGEAGGGRSEDREGGEDKASGANDAAAPARQNRRGLLIDAALAPARHRFKDDVYERLRAALSLLFGTESMVVFRDVLPLDAAAARRVKSWAARALVRAALKESKAGR